MIRRGSALLLGYCLALVLSWRMGARILPLPFPAADAVKVVFGSVGMAAVLLAVDGWRGPLALAAQVTVGALIYAALVLGLNTGGAWHALRSALGRRMQTARMGEGA